ncbi:hypothetical protein ACFWP2_27450 [Kitasatospora sp. NPDC058444]|uniref:hypothetical protein n=1 Tax=Kitasatospora sp. NPDC058444 TaxID=3346504 RepID=UPI0036599F52
MRHLTALLEFLRTILATGTGRRGRPSPLAPIRLGILSLLTRAIETQREAASEAQHQPAREPIRPKITGQYCAPWAQRANPWAQQEVLYQGPTVRPFIDRDGWRAELDEIERQYLRQEALLAAAEGRPDTGYSYPGAHALGAVA